MGQRMVQRGRRGQGGPAGQAGRTGTEKRRSTEGVKAAAAVAPLAQEQEALAQAAPAGEMPAPATADPATPATADPAPTHPFLTAVVEQAEALGTRVGAAARTLGVRAGTGARAAYQRGRALSPESWVWVGIITLATVLRFWGLGDKPLHHDESMHAFFSLVFARDPSSYKYDPLLHGPFQFHAEGLIFAIIIGASHLFGVASAAGNPWINDTTARILPATTGVVLVALTYGLRRDLGRVGAVVAAFLLAISPTFVYFSRFLREDIYFACFTYATIVCAAQFAHKRTMRWLVATMVAFVLAYATKEAIYLNMAIFGSFLVVLAVWELGYTTSRWLPALLSERERAFIGHAAPLLLLGAIGSAAAGLGLHTLNQLSVQINAHTSQTDVQVVHLENQTVAVLLYASIAVALIVIAMLIWQIFRDVAPAGTARFQGYASALDGAGGQGDPWGEDQDGGSELSPAPTAWTARVGERMAHLRAGISAEHQPFLRMLAETPWVYWFVAFVVGWLLFAALYVVIPPGPDHNISNISVGFQIGVGRGIWQGLYYWIQQQHVARGGQPLYYYLLLIPLYEQLAVVFGLIGVVLSLLRPTRFRLMLVFWFAGTLGLYSWAGEKMPWLSMHILLPLMLLAAVALQWMIQEAMVLADRLATRHELSLAGIGLTRRQALRPASAVAGLALALLLLVPMLYGMLVLTHKDAANGPHEMMVYVQTTPDVQRVMDKITRADALMYGGRHQLRIAVGVGEEWPLYWYLRDYWLDQHPSTYVSWGYAASSPNAQAEDVLIMTASDAQAFMTAHPTGYRMRTYQLRSWWDEGYKPAPCVPTRAHPCPPPGELETGVGLAQWLSFGVTAAVPAHPTFDAGRAATRLWNWLWLRKPLGVDSGPYYEFVFIVRDGVPIQP
ncbi:MAG: hypothetical protein PVSMB4_02020 [Ktedonobacterales bacterium]